MVVRHLVTAEELLQIPDAGSSNELVDGELRRKSPASNEHSCIGAEIIFLLRSFTRERGLGAVFNADAGYLLSRFPDTVLCPDASFVSANRLPQASEWQGFFPFAPDLVFEVLSPSNTAREMTDKTRRYLAAGTVVVVIVDPRSRSVQVHQRGAPAEFVSSEGILDLGQVIPGLLVPVSSIFAGLADSR